MGTPGSRGNHGDGTPNLRPLVAERRVEKGFQAMAAARVAELSKRLRLDLANTFSRYGEVLADFFKRVLASVLKAEAHFDDLLFAGAKRLENLGRLFAKVEINHRFRR